MSINIAEIKQWVNSNITGTLAVKDVARELAIPVDTLRKAFLRAEQRPLSKFIVDTKVDKMKDLLTKTDKRCYEIAFSMGFREDAAAHFFKKQTGLTMKEYRLRSYNNQ